MGADESNKYSKERSRSTGLLQTPDQQSALG